MTTTEEKRTEAVARMKLWGIFPPIVRAFETKGTVAESVPPLGACFWLNDAQKERVRQFEEEHKALVYHVIHHTAIFGGTDKFELEEYLYVSDYPEEWEDDRYDISTSPFEDGKPLVYCNNLTAPDCSEFGTIGIKKTPAGGLARVW